MRRSRLILISALWASSPLLACVKFSAEEPSTGIDAGRDAAAPDAAMDGPAPDAGAGFLCPAGANVFCDDFEGSAINSEWHPFTPLVAVTYALDRESARGGGQALRVRLSAGNPDKAQGGLSRELGDRSLPLKFAFAFAVNTPSTDEIELMAFQFKGTSTDALVSLAAEGSHVKLAAQRLDQPQTAIERIATTILGWHDYTLEISNTKGLVLTVDKAETVAIPAPPNVDFQTSSIEVRLGVTYAPPKVGPFEVSFDNVVMPR